MSYPMALIDRRFNVRLQNMPRGEYLDEKGPCISENAVRLMESNYAQ